VLETKGLNIEQIEDLKWLMFGDWNWEEDKKFCKEFCIGAYPANCKQSKPIIDRKISEKCKQITQKQNCVKTNMWDRFIFRVLGQCG